MKLSSRMDRLSESLTLKLNALVQTLKSQGQDVINLTTGETDFDVPEQAKQAVIKALNENRNKYTPAAGIPELREAVAVKTNTQQPGVNWQGKNVVISNGGKQALFNTFMALLDEGDEVLIPSPFWLTYPESVRIAGGEPKVLSTRFEEGFKLRPEVLTQAISARTRLLILNSPSNPSGVLYRQSELRALADCLASFPDVCVVSDEIYDRIIYGEDPFCSFLGAAPEMADRTITVNGMSKSSAMTGWRIGWTVAPEPLTQAIIKIQGQTTSGINSLAQWASLAALKIPEAEFSAQISSLSERRDRVLDIMRKSGKIEICAPSGAFYAFLGVRNFLRKGEDSVGFAERLLQEAKVAVVPGTPFGEPNFVRMSFATAPDLLQEGCERFVQFIEDQSP